MDAPHGSSRSRRASRIACGRGRGLLGNRYPPRRRDGAAGRSGRLKRLLPCAGSSFEQDAEPLHMVESTAFRVGHRSRRALAMPSRWPSWRRAVDRRCCSNVVLLNGSSGTDIGVQDRRAVRGARRVSGLEPMLEDGGDTRARRSHRMDGDLRSTHRRRDRGAGCRGSGRKPCSGCGRRVSTVMISAWCWDRDRASPALEALGFHSEYSRCALGMWSGKVLAPWAAIARRACCNTLTAVEHLQPCARSTVVSTWLGRIRRAGREAEEPGVDLDVIVDANPGKRPFGASDR